MTAHRYVKHTKCQRGYCMICDGGLCTCEVCGASEGQLTKHCPERVTTRDERDAVIAGQIDYVDGKWINIVKLTP